MMYFDFCPLPFAFHCGRRQKGEFAGKCVNQASKWFILTFALCLLTFI